MSNVNISDEYLYDACGNTTADLNRGIAWVKYNCLHLPTTIQFSNGNKSSYAYDARGMKRSVQHAFSLSGIQIPFGADTVKTRNPFSRLVKRIIAETSSTKTAN